MRSERQENKLQISQRNSVSKYAESFRSLLLQIPDMAKEEQLDRFIRGLKLHLRKEVIVKAPTTLDEAIRLAERIDSIRFTPNGHSSPSAPFPRADAMDIDNVQLNHTSSKRISALA